MLNPSSFLILALGLQINSNLAPPDADPWEKTRRIAETQHEIVMLLIKRQHYGQVLEASQQIFSLRFPPQQEHLFVEEGRILSDALAHQAQYDLAQKLLDQALGAVRSNRARAVLTKEKAYLFSKAGNDDEAMVLFQEALKLDRTVP